MINWDKPLVTTDAKPWPVRVEAAVETIAGKLRLVTVHHPKDGPTDAPVDAFLVNERGYLTFADKLLVTNAPEPAAPGRLTRKVWINVYVAGEAWHIAAHESRDSADKGAGCGTRLACLERTLEFVEGEGLETLHGTNHGTRGHRTEIQALKFAAAIVDANKENVGAAYNDIIAEVKAVIEIVANSTETCGVCHESAHPGRACLL